MTQFCQRKQNEKTSTLKKIKLPRVGKNDNHQNDSSHITIDELLERMQECK